MRILALLLPLLLQSACSDDQLPRDDGGGDSNPTLDAPSPDVERDGEPSDGVDLSGGDTATDGALEDGPPPATKGIWISAAELASRPTSGGAWDSLKQAADSSLGTPDLYDQDAEHPVRTMAVALVYARTGDASYRQKAAAAVMSIIVGAPPAGGRSLGLGRNLAAYVIAADLIDLPQHDPAKEQTFRKFLQDVRFWTNDEGRSLVECHAVRPNNWGTMCGASRIAADLYLGDSADLTQAIAVFKGYIGDRAAYAGFTFQPDAFSWMCDPASPRPVNPKGCAKDGHDLSGAPVDDVQRGGPYQWPPAETHYAWGGFSAAVAQAEMLHRAGHAAYQWQDEAIRRGMQFLTQSMPSSESNPTEWMAWLVNLRYGTNFPAATPTGFGRLVGWTDWTHGS